MQSQTVFTAGCLHTGSHIPAMIYSTIIEMAQSKIKISTTKVVTPPEAEQEDEMITKNVLHFLPTINMAATGKNITKLRVEAGLSVKALQDIFGFTTPQAIYKWQHGTAMPTIDNLVVLAAVFEVPVDEIIAIDVNVKARISA